MPCLATGVRWRHRFLFLDLGVLMEETGRACLHGPFLSTVVLGAITLLEVRNDQQKNEILPAVSAGKMILTLALTEPGGKWDASGVKIKAEQIGEDYVISGTKCFVPDANVADSIIVVATTSKDSKPEEGITLFLVNGNCPGVKCHLLRTIGSDKQCELALSSVKVSAAKIIGQAGQGWPVVQKVLRKAAIAKCAEMVGGAQQVLEMTVQYAKDRIQFGQPIGSFQAIHHHCANMATDVNGARLITFQAAWMLSEGLSCNKEVAMAKAWVSDACKRVARLGHQVAAQV